MFTAIAWRTCEYANHQRVAATVAIVVTPKPAKKKGNRTICLLVYGFAFYRFRMLRVRVLLLLAADTLHYIVCAQYIGSPREFKIKRNAASHMIYLEL